MVLICLQVLQLCLWEGFLVCVRFLLINIIYEIMVHTVAFTNISTCVQALFLSLNQRRKGEEPNMYRKDGTCQVLPPFNHILSVLILSILNICLVENIRFIQFNPVFRLFSMTYDYLSVSLIRMVILPVLQLDKVGRSVHIRIVRGAGPYRQLPVL